MRVCMIILLHYNTVQVIYLELEYVVLVLHIKGAAKTHKLNIIH